MTRRTLLWSVLVALAIQAPFLIALDFGIHSSAGGVGYLFYFPSVILAEHLPDSTSRPWQNNRALLETALVIMQTIMITFLISGIRFAREMRRHTGADK